MERNDIASYLDVTLVQTNHSKNDIDNLISASKENKFACVFTLPCYAQYTKDCLQGTGVHIGGVVGFPSGGEFLETKQFEARQNVAMDLDEIDMVINVGWLLSDEYDKVRDEIKLIKDIVCERPLKCIIEISLLSEYYAKKAAELIVEAGADYVKTGTGWIAPTTIEHIKLLKSVVGDSIYIKAAGGIRSREIADSFLAAGAYRLGVGMKNVEEILKK